MIKKCIKKFTHRSVNLNSIEKFAGESGLLFKNSSEIYSLDNEDASIEEIKIELRKRLRVCNSLLQKIDLDIHGLEYSSVLKNNGVNITNTDDIWKLRKFLKYVLYIGDDVKKILK
jgi:hypothetical protein